MIRQTQDGVSIESDAPNKTNYESLFGTPEATAQTLAIVIFSSTMDNQMSALVFGDFSRYIAFSKAVVKPLEKLVLKWLNEESMDPSGEVARALAGEYRDEPAPPRPAGA